MDFQQAGPVAQRATDAAQGYSTAFGRPAELVARAPGRVNLIGEHTDYNEGLCLPVALAHATYAAVGARTDGLVRVVSRQSPTTWAGGVEDAGPGRVTGWPAYAAGVLWALARDGLDLPGMDVYVDSEVPVGAGLSSSAALECAVAVAAVSLAGRELDDPLRTRLVHACMAAESEVAGAPTGGLDQSVSLFARAGHALLLDFADGSRRQVPLPLAAAGLTVLVVDTRVSHALTDGGYAARRAGCVEAATALGLSSLRQATVADLPRLTDERLRALARHVVTETARVAETVAAVGEGDWVGVGELFAASHAALRDDYRVSCPELDLVVETAVAAGALGARMTGGGFGGSAIALVARDRLQAVAGAVTAAFDQAGLAAPVLLTATGAAGASRCL
ncbi:MAG TPA: galactokinase [Nocardioides sp.]|uniref:galactokinase n=1 Tax=Nocardioides sp. TaxID=35761 RepID=UPI002C6AD7DF|nr:galactokinase [Nocardioides sp.]HQR27225.1 galactokinase [Nocardioides sp.]